MLGVNSFKVALCHLLPVVAEPVVPVTVLTSAPLALKRRTEVFVPSVPEYQARLSSAVVAPGVRASISGSNCVPVANDEDEKIIVSDEEELLDEPETCDELLPPDENELLLSKETEESGVSLLELDNEGIFSLLLTSEEQERKKTIAMEIAVAKMGFVLLTRNLLSINIVIGTRGRWRLL